MASSIFFLSFWSSDLNYSNFGEKRNIYIQELHSIHSISNRFQSILLFFVTFSLEIYCTQIYHIFQKWFHWIGIVLDSWLCFHIQLFPVEAEFVHASNEWFVTFCVNFLRNTQQRISLAKTEHQNKSWTFYFNFNHSILKKRRSFIYRLTHFKYWYELKPSMLLRPNFDTAPTIYCHSNSNSIQRPLWIRLKFDLYCYLSRAIMKT